MALPTCEVRGNVPRPDGTYTANGKVIFTMTGFDTTVANEIVMPDPVEADISGDGVVSALLWPNTAGFRGTQYTVVLRWKADMIWRTRDLGNIEVPEALTADLADLLGLEAQNLPGVTAAVAASAALAKKYAAEAEDTEVEPGLYSALHYALASAAAALAVSGDLDTIEAARDVVLAAQAAVILARDATLSARAAVEEIFDNFDDRYLGAKAADPTVDNDGDPLVAGQVYFNTVAEEVRFYNGATWESPDAQAAASAAAALASEQAAAAHKGDAQAAAGTATAQAVISTDQAAIATTKAGEASDSAATATAKAGEASDSASAAAASAGDAAASATQSEANRLISDASAALAVSARDAAFVNAGVYADIATGRAAVADGEQFQVVTGDQIIRYRRDSSSTQTEVARYPAARSVTAMMGALGTLTAALGQVAREQPALAAQVTQGLADIDALSAALQADFAAIFGAAITALTVAGQLSGQINGGQISLRGGSLADPPLRIGSVGIYSSATDTLSVAIAGVERLRVTATGITVYGVVTEV